MSNWTVANSGAFPVEMTSFTAAAQKMSAQLKWNTATEVNNYGFEIERRAIASNVWAKVGFVFYHRRLCPKFNFPRTRTTVISGFAWRATASDAPSSARCSRAGPYPTCKLACTARTSHSRCSAAATCRPGSVRCTRPSSTALRRPRRRQRGRRSPRPTVV